MPTQHVSVPHDVRGGDNPKFEIAKHSGSKHRLTQNILNNLESFIAIRGADEDDWQRGQEWLINHALHARGLPVYYHIPTTVAIKDFTVTLYKGNRMEELVINHRTMCPAECRCVETSVVNFLKPLECELTPEEKEVGFLAAAEFAELRDGRVLFVSQSCELCSSVKALVMTANTHAIDRNEQDRIRIFDMDRADVPMNQPISRTVPSMLNVSKREFQPLSHLADVVPYLEGEDQEELQKRIKTIAKLIDRVHSASYQYFSEICPAEGYDDLFEHRCKLEVLRRTKSVEECKGYGDYVKILKELIEEYSNS